MNMPEFDPKAPVPMLQAERDNRVARALNWQAAFMWRDRAKPGKSRYYLFLGPWDVRVTCWLWVTLPLAGHIEGGAR